MNIIKLHHSLGYENYFMAMLFYLAMRVDHPDLPTTFPSAPKHRLKSSWPGIAPAKYFYETMVHDSHIMVHIG